MSTVNPGLVAAAPELAILDLVADAIETSIIAILAEYPCLADDQRRSCCVTTMHCRLAETVIDRLYALDNAIIHYRNVVEADVLSEHHEASF